jgi:hypothetical protein
VFAFWFAYKSRTFQNLSVVLWASSVVLSSIPSLLLSRLNQRVHLRKMASEYVRQLLEKVISREEEEALVVSPGRQQSVTRAVAIPAVDTPTMPSVSLGITAPSPPIRRIRDSPTDVIEVTTLPLPFGVTTSGQSTANISPDALGVSGGSDNTRRHGRDRRRSTRYVFRPTLGFAENIDEDYSECLGINTTDFGPTSLAVSRRDSLAPSVVNHRDVGMVVPNKLYVSAAKYAFDAELMESLGIGAYLCVADNVNPACPPHAHPSSVLHIPTADKATSRLEDHMTAVFDFIDSQK